MSFPVLWPQEYRQAALALGHGSPLLAMGNPTPWEEVPDPEGFADPSAENRFSPVPFLVRKHRNKALALATSRCFFYCRFCFRRAEPPGPGREPGKEHWARIYGWLAEAPEIEELILSGGDPLTLPDASLSKIARALTRIPHLRRWRIHTRAPIVRPDRVTRTLLRSLENGLPLRYVIHVNHAAELRDSSLRAIQALQGSGAPVLSQTVLLAGVNDQPTVLADLFQRLGALGVAPRYLHHPDRARGNGRFRITVERGLDVYRELSRQAGLPIPLYVLDLPNGSGKCPAHRLVPVAEERDSHRRRVRYRWERPAGWDGLSEDRAWEWWDIWGPTFCRRAPLSL